MRGLIEHAAPMIQQLQRQVGCQMLHQCQGHWRHATRVVLQATSPVVLPLRVCMVPAGCIGKGPAGRNLPGCQGSCPGSCQAPQPCTGSSPPTASASPKGAFTCRPRLCLPSVFWPRACTTSVPSKLLDWTWVPESRVRLHRPQLGLHLLYHAQAQKTCTAGLRECLQQPSCLHPA